MTPQQQAAEAEEVPSAEEPASPEAALAPEAVLAPEAPAESAMPEIVEAVIELVVESVGPAVTEVPAVSQGLGGGRGSGGGLVAGACKPAQPACALAWQQHVLLAGGVGQARGCGRCGRGGGGQHKAPAKAMVCGREPRDLTHHDTQPTCTHAHTLGSPKP